MSTLLSRTQRACSFFVALMFVATLFAPIMATAGTDLVAGDTALVGGSGANLRSDNSTTESTNVIAELPAGSSVVILEGPISTDTGVWYHVSADGIAGYVSAELLTKSDAPTPTEPAGTDPSLATSTAIATQTSQIPWAEPIDRGTVVDSASTLTQQGLPVRNQSYGAGDIVAYVPVGTEIEVTAPREMDGTTTWVRVNFQGNGGYVDGRYLVLQSETVTPTVEVVPTETPVPTEAITPTEAAATEVVPTATEALPTETPTEVLPTSTPTSESTPTIVVPTEAATIVLTPAMDQSTSTAAADAATPTIEIVATDVPTQEATPTSDPTEDGQSADATPTAAVSTPDVAAPATSEIASPEVTAEPATVVTTPNISSTPEPSQNDVSTPAASVPVTTGSPAAQTPAATQIAQQATMTSTAAPTVTTAATRAATTVAPTVVVKTPMTTAPATVATVARTTSSATKTPATATATSTSRLARVATVSSVQPRLSVSSVAAFDPTKMLGSATVTGTTNGLICRVAPDPSSPIIMTLREGTKVLVHANPVNGWLGIDCGGLKGYAEVKYLYSGGAADGEITKSNMTVAVSGTGTGLNCRASASMSATVLTVIPDGTKLTTRGAATNGWTPVVCGGQNGYVYTQYISVVSGSTSSTAPSTSTTTSSTGTVNTGGDGLRCRAGAGTSYPIITTLSSGSSVTVRGSSQNGWTPVTCAGTNGWVYSSYLSVKSTSSTTAPKATTTPKATAPATSTTTGTATVANTGGQSLNCRSGAGTSYPVITTLALGQSVSIRPGSVSGWTAVICGGRNGFISSDFATVKSSTSSTTPNPGVTPTPIASGPTTMVSGAHVATTDSLNLRYAPGGNIALVMPAGTVILVTATPSNGWVAVNYDGIKGYASTDYLKVTSAALSLRGGSGSGSGSTTTTPVPTVPPTTGGGNSALVSYAERYLGYPYVWATHGPSSFDCSGFTGFVVKQVLGIDIGYSTWSQIDAGTPVTKDKLQPGDLVFFQNTYAAGLSHVGMYIGNGQFIHAQNETTGVVISDLNSTYYGPRWYGAVRIG